MTDTKRPEQERRAMADPRYTEVPIPCQHCQHLVSMGNQFDKEGWTCLAFPSQILYRILTLRDHHTEVFVSQEGDYVFEPVVYQEEDTGRAWHYTADARWRYVDDPPEK